MKVRQRGMSRLDALIGVILPVAVIVWVGSTWLLDNAYVASRLNGVLMMLGIGVALLMALLLVGLMGFGLVQMAELVRRRREAGLEPMDDEAFEALLSAASAQTLQLLMRDLPTQVVYRALVGTSAEVVTHFSEQMGSHGAEILRQAIDEAANEPDFLLQRSRRQLVAQLDKISPAAEADDSSS